ncbi:MAG: hypothetical protein EPO61_09885 [Nitrospirae bacterium]|nr:MAG: hypothetical protein EPO61_09885 [Nitrospirota bacterium]
MVKVAILVLADTQSQGDLARVANALEAVKEFKEAKDDVRLIFDGAGVKWPVDFSKPDHTLNGLFEAVRDRVTGVCGLCAQAFGVQERISLCGIPLFDRHLSLRKFISAGYQVITF